MTDNIYDSLQAMRERWERERRAEAEAVGLTLEDYEAKHAAAREAREAALRLAPSLYHAKGRINHVAQLMGGRLAPDVLRALFHEVVSKLDAPREVVAEAAKVAQINMRPAPPLRVTRALSAVRTWLDDRDARPVLVLSGGVGCGKTVATAAALAKLGGDYVRASDLAARHEPYSFDRDRKIEPLDLGVALLAIDDLGTERRNANGQRDGRFAAALSDIVDARQHAGRTLITTNLTPKRFADEYCDDRLRSRLRACAEVEKCGTTDMRNAE